MAPRSDSQWSDSTLQCQWKHKSCRPWHQRLSASRLRSLMPVLGLYNTSTGALEGCDDPGRVFVRRPNVRALLCAWSLLQLQGCEDAAPSSSWATFQFTLLRGLVMMLRLVAVVQPIWTMPQTSLNKMRQNLCLSRFAMDEAVDTMPLSLPLSPGVATISPDPLSSNFPVSTTPTGGRSIRGFDTEDQPIPNQVFSPEAMLTWMYTRSLRRQSALEEGTLRWALYAERINVIEQVIRACRNGDEATCQAAAEMTRNMADISEDENSPTQELSVISTGQYNE